MEKGKRKWVRIIYVRVSMRLKKEARQVNQKFFAFKKEEVCDNIGLVLACLPSGSTNATGSPSCFMTQPSGIPILSPLCMLVIPIFLLFKCEEFLIYL